MKTRKGGREKDEKKQEKEAERKMKTRKRGREKDENKKKRQGEP